MTFFRTRLYPFQRTKQDQVLRRLMLELELHRARIEAERLELNSKLNILSKEVSPGARMVPR